MKEIIREKLWAAGLFKTKEFKRRAEERRKEQLKRNAERVARWHGREVVQNQQDNC